MNAVSTPKLTKGRQCCVEPFNGVTPIKTHVNAESGPADSEFDGLLDSVIADSIPSLRDGKRKATIMSDKSQLIPITPVLNRVKKRLKTNDTLSSLDGPKFTDELMNANPIDKLSTDHITLGVDMFEEELMNSSINFSLLKQECQHETRDLVENSSDIIQNSIFGNGSELFDHRPLHSGIINDIVKKGECNCMIEKFEHEDSCDLQVSVEKETVVDSILKTIDLKTCILNNEEEVSNEHNVAMIGFSQIIMESVLNWENNSGLPKFKDENINDAEGTESHLDERITRKLLNNAIKTEISKTIATGWSQMDKQSSMDDSLMKNSQYQELGPFFGLPSRVQQLYEEHKGIKDLYFWQKECLLLRAVKERKNLVYSLPTSGGKTLVAEILILRELLCYKRNVLFILPFVSIVQEKVHDLSTFAIDLGFLVEEYAAGKGVIPLRKRRKRKSVIIATIEKASAVVISLIETKQLEEFGLIVVDELHLLSEDSGRGATLESLLTLILHLGEKIQIVGMTATIGNLNEIAAFLTAETYTGTFRPVELTEHVKCGNELFKVSWDEEDVMQSICSIKSPPSGTDPDGICDLILDVVPNDSVLVFCPTKKNCENVAVLIAEVLPKELICHKEEEKLSFMKALATETNGQMCPIMKRTIPYGIVYHHSGLTPGERKLLEEAFRLGTICVICCTSTLAAGVNLPAARVILRSPYIGKDFISLSKYKQMVGRAGRAGMGCKGESYLICQQVDRVKVGTLLKSKMDDSISKMDLDNLKSLILSSIGLGIAKTRGELRKLVYRTLLSVQATKLNINVKKMIDNCISSLFKMGAIRVSDLNQADQVDNSSKLDISMKKPEKNNLRITNDSQLGVSRLGRAAMKGSIGLERAHELYGDLIKAQSSLVLLTDLHLLYLVTPYDILDQIKPNYSVYFNVYMQLSAKDVHAVKTIGITEFIISKLATGMKPKNISESILNRLYVALILNEMLKQQNLWVVAKLFEMSAGIIQTLITSTSTFANNVMRFCEELSELWSFKSLLTDFSPRLTHCCSVELIPLMELPAVKRGRAKQLYDAGFKTLNIIANADVNELVRSVDHLPRKVAGQLVAAARLLLLERAENLKEEAEEVLNGLVDKVFKEE